MIPSFQFSCPTKTAFGAHALYHLPFDLAGMDACKAFVITDKQACEAQLDLQLSQAFKDSDMSLGIATLTDTDELNADFIEKLYHLFTEKGYDSIIALGTEKAVQIAKVLNMVLSLGPEFLRHFKEIQDIKAPLLPLVFIPNLPTDGRESIMETLFQDRTFVSPFLMPDLVVISPDTMLSAPDDIILNSALSSFAICCEAFVFSDNPLVRPYADLGIRLIMDSLLPLLRDIDLDKKEILYGKAGKKRKDPLSRIVHAAVISGYMKSNVSDMKTAKKSLARDMPRDILGELIHIFEGNASPYLTRLLLPLTDQDQYSATPEIQRPEAAIHAIQDFINELSVFFPKEASNGNT